MENIRGRNEDSQQTTQTGSTTGQNRTGAPVGFEGMNFEQQRGSYKNGERGSYENDKGRKSPEQAGENV